MQLLAYTALAAVAFVVAYAFGLGGAVSGLIFLAILTLGVIHRASEPILSWIRG